MFRFTMIRPDPVCSVVVLDCINPSLVDTTVVRVADISEFLHMPANTKADWDTFGIGIEGFFPLFRNMAVMGKQITNRETKAAYKIICGNDEFCELPDFFTDTLAQLAIARSVYRDNYSVKATTNAWNKYMTAVSARSFGGKAILLPAVFDTPVHFDVEWLRLESNGSVPLTQVQIENAVEFVKYSNTKRIEIDDAYNGISFASTTIEHIVQHGNINVFAHNFPALIGCFGIRASTHFDASKCPRIAYVQLLEFDETTYERLLVDLPSLQQPPVVVDHPPAGMHTARALVATHAPHLLFFFDNNMYMWMPRLHAAFKGLHRATISTFIAALAHMEIHGLAAYVDPAVAEEIPRHMCSVDDDGLLIS